MHAQVKIASLAMTPWRVDVLATRRTLLQGALVAALAPPLARAADYPARPIRVIVPYAPGGALDTVARVLGAPLGEALGQSVVTYNRPGGGGLLGMNEAAKASPDGYTLLLDHSGLAYMPGLHANLPFDPVKDFAGVITAVSGSYVLAVNNDLPVKSVADLVKLAKERPLSYGSGGVGAFHHLLGELFNQQFGTRITHVPYRGTLPALNDLVAGHIQMLFADLAPAYPQIQAGNVRALGVTTGQRVSSAPELAPLSEVGAPGFDWAAWQAVAVPGRVSPDIRATLNSAIEAAMGAPDVQKQLVSLQFVPVGKSSPAELDRFVASETERWAKVLQQAGVAGTQ